MEAEAMIPPRKRRFRRSSGGTPHTRPGFENDNQIITHCYHLSGDNEIRSIDGGLKDFQNSSQILKDFKIGRIGRSEACQIGLKLSNAKARTFANTRNTTFERKTYISSVCNHLWQEKLYGTTRVAVYGVGSVCVVTRNEDFVLLEKDLARYGSNLPNALIAEILDLVILPSELKNMERWRHQTPFGVVSVVEDTNGVHKVNGHEASSDVFDELKAIKFLQEELNSASTLSFFKTVKTAICALQHLFNKKFKPKEIRVFVWTLAWPSNRDAYGNDGPGRELKIRDERSIEDILAVINNKPRNNIEEALVGRK